MYRTHRQLTYVPMDWTLFWPFSQWLYEFWLVKHAINELGDKRKWDMDVHLIQLQCRPDLHEKDLRVVREESQKLPFILDQERFGLRIYGDCCMPK